MCCCHLQKFLKKPSFSGIGSREIPLGPYLRLQAACRSLAALGYVLRSGGAGGADTACEIGCDSAGGDKEIYLPWKGFNDSDSLLYKENLDCWQEAYHLASFYHPNWKNLSEDNRQFHTRNMFQVLGRNLNDPVEFILCYTPEGKQVGGTAQAMRVAVDKGIPIHNLFFDDAENFIRLL